MSAPCSVDLYQGDDASLLADALHARVAELVGDAFASTDERTRIFALIDAATSTLAMIAQLLIVRRVIGRFGIGITLTLLPLISLVGFALLAVNPVFAVVAILQLVRRSLGFGLTKPTNDMLYSELRKRYEITIEGPASEPLKTDND